MSASFSVPNGSAPSPASSMIVTPASGPIMPAPASVVRRVEDLGEARLEGRQIAELMHPEAVGEDRVDHLRGDLVGLRGDRRS